MKSIFFAFALGVIAFAALIIIDVTQDNMREKTVSDCVLSNQQIKPCMGKNGYKNYKYPYN